MTTNDSPDQPDPAGLLRQALASRTLDRDDNTPATPPPSPEEIADKFPQFEITECLGRGGMGVVYKARQKSLKRAVAIKILAPERVGDPKFAERFEREAQTLAQLNHPNIVTVFDYGETDGLYYIVMEYVDGVNLRDLLQEGKLEAAQALGIVPPICEALQFAHDRGIVHRDIKPENLLLDNDGRIKIADFGIATLIGTTGEASGTPPYMAPEQSGSQVDHRADIYALGVVLYEMLTGQRPTSDPTAKTSTTDLKLDDMVSKAMARNPDERFQTAEEFRTIATEAATKPVAASPPPIATPAAKPKGMFRRFWGILVPAIIGAPVAAIFFLYIAAYAAPKKFESQTTIQVNRDSGPASPSFIATQFEAITSTKALMQVSEKLDLRNRWMLGDHEILELLRKSIRTEHHRGTDLITIRMRHTDPHDAADIANTVTEVYIERMKQSTPRTGLDETGTPPRLPVTIHEKAVPMVRSATGTSFFAIFVIFALSLIILPLLALLLMAILHKVFPQKQGA